MIANLLVITPGSVQDLLAHLRKGHVGITGMKSTVNPSFLRILGCNLQAVCPQPAPLTGDPHCQPYRSIVSHVVWLLLLMTQSCKTGN